MVVLGQAYFNLGKEDIVKMRLGRQLVDSFYTKSNDTKMIPNTFDGVVFDSKALNNTAIKLGYLYKQKLRDKSYAHSVLMYGDDNATPNVLFSKYSQNDDSAMHRGLTYTKLKAAGVDTQAPLIIGDIHNTTVDNLKIDASFYVVPQLVSQLMGELNYTLHFNKVSVTPAIRYVKQFDNGAGAIGGASLFGQAVDGQEHGYTNPNSVDSQMLGLRVVTKYENFELNLAYTHIADEADMITPWRGFVTGGYTRSMARYNWFANMSSYRARLRTNLNQDGIYKDIFTEFSILYTDGDENKNVDIGEVNLKYADQFYYYAGFVQNIPALPQLQWRLRLGYTDTDLENLDNLDARLELNYVF